MRIAVVAPHVPFIRGGTELLADSLAGELRRRGHETDVIRLPFKWYPPERLLLDSLAWRQFDFTESSGQKVDLLIGTKFPSYLAVHPRKVLWLFHQHRLAYDLFNHPAGDPGMAHHAIGNQTRSAIMALDQAAFAECRSIHTISKNVSGRLEQYSGVSAPVLYPPPRGVERFHCEEYGDYVLYVGRLDAMKRVDLLVRAAAGLSAVGRILIAGQGAELEPLKTLAADLKVADRVEFLGYVPDEEIYRLYAGCRAVFYAPLDEDYGFATVEAMLSRKPVVTLADAGGVLEFVTHEETGLISGPEPEALAQLLNGLLADAGLAQRMGRAGHERVKKIRWEPVLDALLSPS